MTQIGFIGLGKIGLPITRLMVEAGLAVKGYRRSAMTEFAAFGGRPAGSPREAAEGCALVFVCLPDDAALKDAFSGETGLFEALVPGQIVVVLSSHPVPVKRRYHDALAERGIPLLDGEVSGTPGMVENRTAAIYLAGDADAVEKVTPVLETVTDKCFYLGAFGSATQVKLVNNLLVATHIVGTAQAMALGLKLGLDPDLLINAVSKGSGGSTQFAIRAPWMASSSFTPQQGPPDALLYYLHNVQRLTAELGVGSELVDCLTDIIERASPRIGDRDIAALVEMFLDPENGK